MYLSVYCSRYMHGDSSKNHMSRVQIKLTISCFD